jgi:hypothetical protein
MDRSRLLVVALAGLALTSGAIAAEAADISVGLNIRVPAPPVVVAAPPVVVMPGSPVQHVPSASFNLFVYHGRYYSFPNGSWFIPPGHAKRVDGPDSGWCPPGQAKKGRC